jgi:hypothetical protein
VETKDAPSKPSRIRQWFPKEPAEPGTKRWYREQRVDHLILWFMPVIPLGYTLYSQGIARPWQTLVAMLIPVLGSGVALACVSRALWRIEINVKGNREHPFTPKDARVLNQSSWILLASWLLAIAVNSVAQMLADDGMTSLQLHPIGTAANIAIVVAFVGAALTATMQRIHHKGWHAWEALKRAESELEKGV